MHRKKAVQIIEYNSKSLKRSTGSIKLVSGRILILGFGRSL